MSNAYVTMIEWEHGGGASVGSISLDALGEPELAGAIRAGDADSTEALVQRLIELDGYYVELRREASGPFEVEQLRSLLRAMLTSIPAGMAVGPSDAAADFQGDDLRIDAAVDEILGSTVLAEYSDAKARTAAAAVGAATSAPVGAVTVAALTAAHIGGGCSPYRWNWRYRRGRSCANRRYFAPLSLPEEALTRVGREHSSAPKGAESEG